MAKNVELILLQDVDNLGLAGTESRNPGHVRNDDPDEADGRS